MGPMRGFLAAPQGSKSLAFLSSFSYIAFTGAQLKDIWVKQKKEISPFSNCQFPAGMDLSARAGFQILSASCKLA